MKFRSQRIDYLKSFFPLIRLKRAKKVAKPAKVYATKRKWKYSAPEPGMCGTVLAFTRSEARSEIKKAHGIKRRGRVPVGALISKV